MEAARLDGSASAGSPARQREAAMELQRAGRFAEALPLLFKAAVAGDGEAQYLMGCYCWSVGGAEDAAGLAWWTQATVGEPPHARAAFRLGLLYSDGRHMDPDLPQAYRMFSLAARQGLPEAALHVAACLRDGRGVTRQLARAVELVMKLAEGGHAPAMHELATMYLHGVPKAKLPQSLALAHQWLLKAADAGFAQALYELGVSFTLGLGCSRDLVAAARYLDLAVRAAVPDAISAFDRLTDFVELAPSLPKPPNNWTRNMALVTRSMVCEKCLSAVSRQDFPAHQLLPATRTAPLHCNVCLGVEVPPLQHGAGEAEEDEDGQVSPEPAVAARPPRISKPGRVELRKCDTCGDHRGRDEFSKKQWKKATDRKCLECVKPATSAADALPPVIETVRPVSVPVRADHVGDAAPPSAAAAAAAASARAVPPLELVGKSKAFLAAVGDENGLEVHLKALGYFNDYFKLLSDFGVDKVEDLQDVELSEWDTHLKDILPFHRKRLLSDDAYDQPLPVGNGGVRVSKDLIYYPQRVLGIGATSQVVEGVNASRGRVAVKIIGANYQKQVETEVKALQRLDEHPHVVSFYGMVPSKLNIFLVLGLCVMDLTKLFDPPEQLTPPQVQVRSLCRDKVRLAREICEGVAFLHNKMGYNHRDLKPANVLLDESGLVKISDLGIAKAVGDDLPASTLLSVGTIGWRAPEVCTPGTTTSRSAAADMFSIGLLAHYLFSQGAHPFGAEGKERERNILAGRRVSPQLDEPVQQHFVSLCLAPEPKQRPPILLALAHPLFLKPDERLDYLKRAWERFEAKLRMHSANSWQRVVEPEMREALEAHPAGDTLADQLRIIRNVAAHKNGAAWTALQHAIGLDMLPTNADFMDYIEVKWPQLILRVFELLGSIPL